MNFLLFALVAGLDVTPVQKVIQLLNGMAEKGKQEKHEEQVQFVKYKQFCEDTSAEKHGAVKEATHKMEQLTASIQKAEADAATLAKSIAELDANMATAEADKKNAAEVRAKQNADYEALNQDYSESIDALGRAMEVLKKQTHDRKQVLAQVSQMKLIPDKAKKVLTAFISQDDELSQSQEIMAVSAPQANAYEFQSQGVIDMLEELHDKFEDERDVATKTEKNQRHAYEMVAKDLTAQIERASEDREAKAREKAQKLGKAASDKEDLAETTATRDSDQTYVTDLDAECSTKATDFENRQQLRQEEIEAIGKATEIMSSGAVSGSADKHLPALMQKSKSVSFMQFSAVVKHSTQEKVAEFLRQKSKALNSRVLMAIALHVAEDPFTKVKVMIKDLIVRLMEEASEEAEHKGWCDTEMQSNKQIRNEKTDQVETLRAEIDELNAWISKLTQEISDLEAAIAETDAAVAEATEIRNAEKAENAQTIKDAKAAQTAVEQATAVLKDFYDKAADATSFAQEKPEIFDTEYKGMQSENGGVIGMLEVILSDFTRLETETTAEEDDEQKKFDGFLTDSAQNKAQNTADVEHKQDKKTQHETTLTAKKGDLEGTQEELDTALAYYEKLKPSCVDAGVSYEDRVTRREEEIQSLKEALKVLGGEDIAFLQK
jgi:hypothetical protein